ncbi:MAG TPA: 3-deoxy-D-manno-octulosonic acid transferase [candidate division Zixibacteria bacterium]|nr:3-deoxy-D-manno-octulosonic acid transferase [candidate division Zixibacteria bacterium]
MRSAYPIYNTVWAAALAAAAPLAPLLLLSGPRFRAGALQRLGWYPALPAGGKKRPIWIHAASVGEVTGTRELTARLKKEFPGRPIVLSAFTHTGHLTARRDPHADMVVYPPLDLVWIVRSALARFDPAALVVIETEIWPNLLREARRRGIPALLLSGRISTRSVRGYARWGRLFREALSCFNALGMQSREDAERIVRLGAEPSRVSVTGSLKLAAASPTRTPRAEGGRLWVAGSTHRGEEEIVLRAFASLKRSFPDLRMALAPRHPERFAEVEKLIGAEGLDFDRKSRLDGRLTGAKDVTLVDTLGDLVDLYAAADVAFVGGSLVAAGGHNLLEPARCRKPVLFGPHTEHFAEIAARLKEAGGGIEIRGEHDLAREIGALLADAELCRSVGERAYGAASQDPEVLDRSVALLARYLETGAA